MGKNILTKELLLKSVEEWNRIREENPDLKPELRGANLSGADLSGADLCVAELRDADLSRADLSTADLRRVTLNVADLSRANLSNANLSGADLRLADLRGANLYRANLNRVNLNAANLNGTTLHGSDISGSDFSDADLRSSDLSCSNMRNTLLSGAYLDEANISNAGIGFTTFGAIDLSRVLGLDTLYHDGPSTIGIDTIYLSNGNIPEAFLRGCGVPDNFIEYARSLTANGIEYYSCFISYSHKNEEFAKRLHTDLQANNVRCWFAPHDLPIGAKTRPAIDDAIRIHDKLLLILSEQSVQSNWVEHEVEHALDLETEREKLVLFPVRLDDAVMDSKTGWASNVKRQRNIGDFTKWKDHDAYQEAFKRLLRDLKQSEKPKK